MSKSLSRRVGVAVLLALGLASGSPSARAGDIFSVTATGSSTTVSAGGSSVLSLIRNLSNNTNQFAPLANHTFDSSVNYAGIDNAINVSQSFDGAGNRVLNLRVPSVGVNKTFSSANGSLDRQIRDYLKNGGLAALSDFQQVVNRSSLAGVMDGNPLAATTLLQDAGFQEFGLHESPFDLNGKAFSTDGGHIVNRYWSEGGVVNAGGVSGQYVDLTLATELHFNDVIGLSFTSPLRFEKLHTADVFMGGEIIGLPINILPAKGGPLHWRLTPAVLGGAAGSQDFLSGGLIYGGQLTSSFNVSAGGFTFTLADQGGYYHGANLDIGGYHFNTRVNQLIFKNGVEVNKSFGNFFVDASGSWTNFTRDAYVSGYFTPQVGLGFKFGRDDSCGFRVGYSGNFGPHYRTNGGNLLLYFTH